MNKLTNFIMLIIALIIILCVGIGYYNLEQMYTERLANEAIIAQVQPAIIQAQNETILHKAIAFNMYSDSVLQVSLMVSLIVLLIGYIVYSEVKYARLQNRINDTTEY